MSREPLIIFSSMLAAILAIQPRGAQAQSSVEAVTRAAIVGYAANMQQFPYYRVQFRMSYAKAKTQADVFDGKWQEVRSFEATHVVDGEYEKYERDVDPPKLTPPNPRVKSGVQYVQVEGFTSRTVLLSDVGKASYTLGVGAINLTRAEHESEFLLDEVTPLDMGFLGHRLVRGPDRMLARPSEFVPTFLGRQNVSGVSLIGVRFEEPKYGAVHEFWLDPAQGYLPARYDHLVHGELTGRSELLEAKQFKPGRWFPTRVVAYGPARDRENRQAIGEIRVLDVDVERRPTVGELSSKIPAGTPVCMYGFKGLFYLKRDETITPHGLPELFTKLEQSRREPLMDTALTAQYPRSRWWIWVSAVVGVVCLFAGFLLWYYKRRAAGNLV